MMLVPEEFDNYQIGVDTDVTFCLKELRVLRKLIGTFLIESQKMKIFQSRNFNSFVFIEDFYNMELLIIFFCNIICTVSYYRLF